MTVVRFPERLDGAPSTCGAAGRVFGRRPLCRPRTATPGCTP
ncbi:hypothetical protein ACRAWD_20235 [Caulobacter segnis]